MNYSSKFLGYMRYRDSSVPEKACTGGYRRCFFVSIYGRLLISVRGSAAVLARILDRDHFIGMNLIETPLNSAPSIAF